MSTAEQQDSDEAIMARLEADERRRKAEAADAQKAADVAVARKLLELRATSAEDLFAVGDSGGAFRGVFCAPTMETWKRWKSEMRGDQSRAVANQNLAVACLRWPDAAATTVTFAPVRANYTITIQEGEAEVRYPDAG